MLRVSAPSSAPLRNATNIGVRVDGCTAAPILGACSLEKQAGASFSTVSSSPVSNARTCTFAESENTSGKRTFRVRFRGDRSLSESTSALFTISFGNAAPVGGGLSLGLTFLDATVTAAGAHAALPKSAVVYPPGSTITGVTGCPSSSFGQDGRMTLVLDYGGPPTSASVTTTITSSGEGPFTVAPYYLDLNAGQRLQYLGPRSQNGTYDIVVEYGYATASGFPKIEARFVLDRTCPS